MYIKQYKKHITLNIVVNVLFQNRFEYIIFINLVEEKLY